MSTALIGYTGFVGSNVAARQYFDHLYNSNNIQDFAGGSFDLVVCAAGQSEAHRVESEPQRDLENLERLAEIMCSASIRQLVHVSTVCVFDTSDRCSEDTEADPDDLTAYGRHRQWLERTLADSFDTLRLRLPQLYGPGIRKGLVFDLANDHRIEHIHPDGEFQYYDVASLWQDITTALDAELSILNLATEPIRHEDLARDVFGIELERPSAPFEKVYTSDMITKHAAVFGSDGDYLRSAPAVKESIRSFVRGGIPPRPTATLGTSP